MVIRNVVYVGGSFVVYGGSPVKWKCLGTSILSFRLLSTYVEMTGVTFSTYWYGIYISVDSLRQASVKCIVLCLIEWCSVVTDCVI